MNLQVTELPSGPDLLFERIVWALVGVSVLLFGLGAAIVLCGYVLFSY